VAKLAYPKFYFPRSTKAERLDVTTLNISLSKDAFFTSPGTKDVHTRYFSDLPSAINRAWNPHCNLNSFAAADSKPFDYIS
jgi:hypothetical protein